MRTKFDPPEASAGRMDSDGKPYPTWNEMVSQLRRDRLGQAQPASPAPQGRDWYDLVADMIIKR